MARTPTTYYAAESDTTFQWATSDNDPFNREFDLFYLSQALERHDHRPGRGKPVGRLDAGAIDIAALGPNSVTSAAIADGAVGTSELADNAVTTAKILNGTIKGEDMEPSAIVDRLNYTPINKAGDTEIGSLSFGKVGPPATSSTLTFLNSGSISIAQGTIAGAGSISFTRTLPGNTADFRTPQGAAIIGHCSHPTDGIGLGILNAAANAYDLIVQHSAATFGVAISAIQPITSSYTHATTPPIAVSNTNLCPNLNANFLGGHPASDFILGTTGGAVPSMMHAFFQSAAQIPATWTRADAANASVAGRVLMNSGTSYSVNFPDNSLGGGNWTHAHTLNNHSHAGFDHKHEGGGAGSFQFGTGGMTIVGAGNVTGTNNSNSSNELWSIPNYAMILAYKN